MRVGQKQKKIDISVPKLDDFIHKTYINYKAFLGIIQNYLEYYKLLGILWNY